MWLVRRLLIKNHYVQFGDLAINSFAEAGAVKIYMDRYGNFYPEMEINNNDLRCASSSLYEFYSENKSTLENALSTYKLSKSDSFDRDIQLLQRATIEKIAKEINARAENYDGVTLLIHGYRNSPEWAQQGYDEVKSFVENKQF